MSRIAKLWDAIFETSRINHEDPVADWKAHDADLQRRAAHLNEKRYAALQVPRAWNRLPARAGR